jgi:hypothetical protein
MTRFQGTFQGQTTGGGPGIKITTGGALLLIGAAVALTHRREAAQDAGSAVTVLAVVLGAAVVSAVVFAVIAVLRARGHRRNPAGAPSPLLCRVSPQPVPAREVPRAVAPAQTVINNFFDANATAAYFREQAVPVYRAAVEPAEAQEIPR